MAKINLGCGVDIRKGFLNVDIKKFSGVDKVIDLNKPRWKLPSNHFYHILLINVLEHLKPMPYDILNEVYRIAKDEAIVEIEVPYCHSASANDIDHVHRGFKLNDFENTLNGIECNIRGRVIEKKFRVSVLGRLIPNIPIKWKECNNLREIAAILLNEIYTHIIIKIEIQK